MGDLATAEFTAKLAAQRKLASDLLSGLPQARDRRLALQLTSNAWGIIGYCAAHLKQFDAAREAFKVCAELSVELLEMDPAPWQLRNSLEMALLAGSKEAEERALRIGVDLVHKNFGPLGSSYLKSLRALIQSDLPNARAAALEAIQLDETATKWKLHRGLGELSRSIIERDESSLAAAVTTVLDSHVRMAIRGPLKGLDIGLLCVPAVCLGIAASRAGLQLPVPETFHAVMLPRVIGALETWNGASVQGQSFETCADIYPRILSTITQITVADATN